MNFDKFKLSSECEEVFEWRKWAEKIPYIKWPSDWEVKAIPPFGGAIIRYNIKKEDKKISVYLDCYGILGGVASYPYWEIYPYKGDTFRCAINEIEELLEAIATALTSS